MRVAAVLAAAAVLAGCATPAPPEPPLADQVRNASTAHLCEAVYYGPRHVAELAEQEASSRRLNCQDYREEAKEAYAQRMAAQAAAAQVPAQAAPVIMYPPPSSVFQPRGRISSPAPVNCRSYYIGSVLHTTC